jgi:tetratricopeptide (TPR) repeat protein
MNGQSSDRRLDVSEHHDRYVENDLIRWIRQGADAVRPHLTTIVAVLAALLVLWAYFAWRRASHEARQTAAWNEFFGEDYETVISKYQDTDAARHARMRIAANALHEGKTLLLSKNGDALKAFEKAQQQFDTIAADAAAPIEMRRSAAYLKATALEASGAPEKAKEQYTKVANQYRDSLEGQQAERRIKELSRPSAIEFYRQLANYKPGDRPTTPKPMRPSNDLEELLRGMGAQNPNLPLPAPPSPKTDLKSDAKDIVPPPPPKKSTAPVPAPGKDLPENEKKPAKDAPSAPPSKPVESPKK